jgi:hypothetical protein
MGEIPEETTKAFHVGGTEMGARPGRFGTCTHPHLLT